MEQADRERLKCLRAFMLRYDDDGELADGSQCMKSAVQGSRHARAAGHHNMAARKDYARQEIARLEALEHAEANDRATATLRKQPTVAPDTELVNATYWMKFRAMDLDRLRESSMTLGPDGVLYLNVPYVTQPGDSLVVEIGSTDDGPLTESFTIKRGDPPYRFTNDTPDGEYRAVESLDDFMREREAKREPAESVEPTPEEAATMLDIAFEQQPASRELVERMVREATSHSKWPVEIVDDYKDYSLAALAHQPQGPRLIIALCDRATDDYESLLGVVQTARESTDALNEDACPACNGSAKVRGYFFGEKQCPDCEGTGVR